MLAAWQACEKTGCTWYEPKSVCYDPAATKTNAKTKGKSGSFDKSGYDSYYSRDYSKDVAFEITDTIVVPDKVCVHCTTPARAIVTELSPSIHSVCTAHSIAPIKWIGTRTQPNPHAPWQFDHAPPFRHAARAVSLVG